MEQYNKTILITGGTGSLGKALVRYLMSKECTVIVYSRDEGKQALDLPPNGPFLKKVIGDVRDFEKLDSVVAYYKPNRIIHAAALKRIDDMEMFPEECIKTNVTGSENVAKVAVKNKVQKCILVSTDKACKPINVYGASKFIAERIFSDYNRKSNSTCLSSVRYGNVIASRGSFIPLFLEKIKNEENIHITSMYMTRFLFTLDDAVQAVLNALEMSRGGEVFIPKINSYTLRDCLEVLGEIAGKPISYEVTGLRPGEKLHEDMLADSEIPLSYEMEYKYFDHKYTGKKLIKVVPQIRPTIGPQDVKYEGMKLNSEYWVSEVRSELKNLIQRGLSQ